MNKAIAEVDSRISTAAGTPSIPASPASHPESQLDFVRRKLKRALSAFNTPKYVLFIKIALVVLCLGVAGHAIHTNVTYVTTDSAVVSAIVLVAGSPIAGRIDSEMVKVGDTLSVGQTLAKISTPLPDVGDLTDAEAEVALLTNQIESAKHEQEALQALRLSLSRRATLYSEQSTARFASLASESDARAASAKADLQRQSQDYDQSLQLLKEGYVSKTDVEHLRLIKESTERTLQAQLANASAAHATARASGSGVLLDNSSSDSPYSLQRQDEVDIRLLELNRRQDDLNAALIKAQTDVSSRRKRMLDQSYAVINASAGGTVWRVEAGAGEMVSIGQPVIETIDCKDILIAARIPLGGLDKVVPGASATFGLPGGGRVAGVVVSIPGDSAAPYRDLAALPVGSETRASGLVIVRASAPPGDCLVGRTGRLAIRIGAN